MGGGVLLDTGFYPITTSRFCFDDEPTAAQAIVDLDPDTGIDRLTSALLRFPARPRAVHVRHGAGALAAGACCWAPRGTSTCFHAWNPAPDRPSELLLETSPALEEPAAERIDFDAVNQYTLLAEQFARAATTGAPPPIALEDSVKNMAVIDALFRSAKSGRLEIVGE